MPPFFEAASPCNGNEDDGHAGAGNDNLDSRLKSIEDAMAKILEAVGNIEDSVNVILEKVSKKSDAAGEQLSSSNNSWDQCKL